MLNKTQVSNTLDQYNVIDNAVTRIAYRATYVAVYPVMLVRVWTKLIKDALTLR